MKLIQEANADDMFNKQMLKVQDAIEKMEKLEIDLPVSSQIYSLEAASQDFEKLAKKFRDARKAKGLK